MKVSSIPIPIWKKINLTVEEAAAYSNIGENRIRDISDNQDCLFVLWVGSKRLIKRKEFEEWNSTIGNI